MWCSVRASNEDLKKERRKERHAGKKKEENEFAAVQWQFVEISYITFQ
jgi:hypothetical protein